MNELFIPYEESLELKKLGFDEPCLFAFDNCSTPMRCSDLRTNEQKFNGVNYNSSTYTSQPTFSQSFKFFREKFCLNSFISFDTIDDSETAYVWNIVEFLPEGKDRKKDTWDFYNRFDSFSSEMCWYNMYKEAELACLKKLIEIVKTK